MIEHDERWPWCGLGDRQHTHTEQLNGEPLVNGQPAGPMRELGYRIQPEGVRFDPTTNTYSIELDGLPADVAEAITAGALRGVSIDPAHMTIELPRPARRGPDLGVLAAERVQDATELDAARRLAPVLGSLAEQRRLEEEIRERVRLAYGEIQERIARAILTVPVYGSDC